MTDETAATTPVTSPREVMEGVWKTFGDGRRDEIADRYFSPDAVIRVQGAPHVPFVGTFEGRQAQRAFFDLGGAEPQTFEVRSVLADGEDVVTLGYFDFLVASTGRHYKGEWALHTRVVDGRIVHWQMFEDSWSVGHAFDA